MDQQLQMVTLGVRDLSASRAFYRDGLGWAGQGVARMSLAHNTDSDAAVDAELARAAAAGGTILKPGQRAAFGGYHGYVADPDGFLWEIAYNPGLVFGADGTVRFTEAES